MRNHLRLKRFHGKQAFAAVYESGGGKLVDKDMSCKIVKFVHLNGKTSMNRGIRSVGGSGVTRPGRGQAIETTPLKVSD